MRRRAPAANRVGRRGDAARASARPRREDLAEKSPAVFDSQAVLVDYSRAVLDAGCDAARLGRPRRPPVARDHQPPVEGNAGAVRGGRRRGRRSPSVGSHPSLSFAVIDRPRVIAGDMSGTPARVAYVPARADDPRERGSLETRARAACESGHAPPATPIPAGPRARKAAARRRSSERTTMPDGVDRRRRRRRRPTDSPTGSSPKVSLRRPCLSPCTSTTKTTTRRIDRLRRLDRREGSSPNKSRRRPRRRPRWARRRR